MDTLFQFITDQKLSLEAPCTTKFIEIAHAANKNDIHLTCTKISELKALMGAVDSSYNEDKQEDAYELLSLLLHKLEEELKGEDLMTIEKPLDIERNVEDSLVSFLGFLSISRPTNGMNSELSTSQT